MPCATVHKVLRKQLHLYSYKVQILQVIKPDVKQRQHEFACEMLNRIDQNPVCLSIVMFSEEATFCVSGTVNKCNAQFWRSLNPHSVREKVRDNPKVNVWCGHMCDKIIGPFFFAEITVTGMAYLDT
ncbi:uncharacterized protein LOC126292273 [Schistocerca gregaria]|uniref:uncharacterized protein LOC126292273 n=1 Tax=Schistocerca gregaria TaxID=7010 RepID=UPI00211DBAB3|nr:uncharacterized protein LOC126292273 [Schistocerca gregaria]XP_049842136.1 uncharacterized protein LOC126292273 [Schistocerca gregaria]XP_049842137.1 uncharacterized protein LOC126292273 [Schistocerca gregaria]XP_049842138.1 uncharacterized protein LOC126292273 [Schistocerca gregaria]